MSSEPLIEFRNIAKIYGSCVANKNVTFKIARGEIHGLIGENGAGKSTAMKLLFGLETPTSGEILFCGKPRPWQDTRGAMSAGLGMVHQHFMLSPALSALDNVILGCNLRPQGLAALSPIRRNKFRRELQKISEEMGFSIDWDKLVGDLPVGVQQQLEIVKLLHGGVEVMIFDEPTAVLTPGETERFFALLLKLKAQGKTIILITHKLKEVKAIAQTFSVLRRGEIVETRAVASASIQEMADLMVGRHVELGNRPRAVFVQKEPVLELQDISIPRIHGSSDLKINHLKIHKGEILGLAGVEGSGQEELLRLILDPSRFLPAGTGRVTLDGVDISKKSCHAIRSMGVGVVPSDRHQQGVLLSETLLENDLLGYDHTMSRGPKFFPIFIDRPRLKRHVQSMMEQFDVRPQNFSALMSSLSGGNQQKFVMARELSRKPKLILISQPTRGVDVGSMGQIHGEILRRRDEGAGVLLISSQLEELMELSDRILVLFEGQVQLELLRSEFNESRIGRGMGGGV